MSEGDSAHHNKIVVCNFCLSEFDEDSNQYMRHPQTERYKCTGVYCLDCRCDILIREYIKKTVEQTIDIPEKLTRKTHMCPENIVALLGNLEYECLHCTNKFIPQLSPRQEVYLRDRLGVLCKELMNNPHIVFVAKQLEDMCSVTSELRDKYDAIKEELKNSKKLARKYNISAKAKEHEIDTLKEINDRQMALMHRFIPELDIQTALYTDKKRHRTN